MTRVVFGALMFTSCAALAQWERCADDSETLQALARSLLCVIEELSDYRAETVQVPEITLLAQGELEAKVCEAPCNVTAAYIPRQGIFLSGYLDPRRELFDRSALLHELVHHLQQGHAKFQSLSGCARERAKEQEAYALQNAYLERSGSARRVTFFDGVFDCDEGQ